MFRRAQMFLVCAVALSPGVSSAFAQTTNVHPGTTLVARPVGEAATNQLKLLERLRHLPKTVGFEPRTFTEKTGSKSSIRYFLFRPKNVPADQPLPLVVSLHGGGPRHKFEDLLEPYAPGFDYGLGRFVAEETQRAHPCYVLAPWSNESNWDEDNLRLTLGVVGALQTEFKLDARRLYVTGQSMGGYGTWSMITKHPGIFAAAVPVCGGGTPGDAAKARAIPVWTFHGSKDGVVPMTQTRDMIAALQKSGAKPVYWEYQEATHADTAERAYCEPELIEWLFSQSK